LKVPDTFVDKCYPLSRQNSFTILDPASGIPSDLGTPKLQASLTSRHSFMAGGNLTNSKNSAGCIDTLTGLINAQTPWVRSNSELLKMKCCNFFSTTQIPSFQRFNTPSLVDLQRCECFGKPRYGIGL